MQHRIYILLIIVSAALCVTCSDRVCCTIIDTDIQLWVLNANGENMLDTMTANHFEESEIRIYDLQDGEKLEVYNPKMDAPRDILFLKDDINGQQLMRLFCNMGRSSNTGTTTTLIQWRENEVDTVETLMYKSESTTYCSKVAYNGVVLVDDSKNTPSNDWDGSEQNRLIKIVKNE